MITTDVLNLVFSELSNNHMYPNIKINISGNALNLYHNISISDGNKVIGYAVSYSEVQDNLDNTIKEVHRYASYMNKWGVCSISEVHKLEKVRNTPLWKVLNE